MENRNAEIVMLHFKYKVPASIIAKVTGLQLLSVNRILYTETDQIEKLSRLEEWEFNMDDILFFEELFKTDYQNLTTNYQKPLIYLLNKMVAGGYSNDSYNSIEAMLIVKEHVNMAVNLNMKIVLKTFKKHHYERAAKI